MVTTCHIHSILKKQVYDMHVFWYKLCMRFRLKILVDIKCSLAFAKIYIFSCIIIRGFMLCRTYLLVADGSLYIDIANYIEL